MVFLRLMWRPGPREPTLLLRWLQEQRVEHFSFAFACGISPRQLRELLTGRVIPRLVAAFLIEKVTQGGVPAASWLSIQKAQAEIGRRSRRGKKK